MQNVLSFAGFREKTISVDFHLKKFRAMNRSKTPGFIAQKLPANDTPYES
jgi:hypothetical protein